MRTLGLRALSLWAPCLWALAAAPLAAPAAAVTLYRIGGEHLPPPAEAGMPGVEFRQLAWTDLGTAGERVSLAVGDAIAPTQYLSLTTLPLIDTNSSLAPLFDRFAFTCGLCDYLTLQGYRCGTGTAACQGAYGRQGTLNIALTDRLFVESVRIHSTDDLGRGLLEDFALTLSPEPLASDTPPLTPFTLEVEDNREAILTLAGFGSQRRTAAIQLAVAEHEQPVTIREVYVYAAGAASAARYTSDIIDFGAPAVWGQVRWGLRSQPGSRVTLVTRGGQGGDVRRYWQYTGIGDQKVEVSHEIYTTLRTHLRAGTTYNYENWTVWSPEADLSDSTRAPPMPVATQRAFQLQLEFRTEGHEGSAVDFIELRASKPAVSQVFGELDPIHVAPGEVTVFTYTLKAGIGPTDTGFDRIRIAAVAAQIDTVLGVLVDDLKVAFTVVESDAGGFVVQLPRVGADLADAPVQVRFGARALRYGASFAGHLLDSARPQDVPQPVPPGDAVEEIFSDRLWIETTVAVRAVLSVVAQPGTITPNGDGINDVTRIVYDLFETTGLVPVRLAITDLAGRRVRLLHADAEAIGHYERSWDGRDDGGHLVSPGIYLFRAAVDVGDDTFDRLGVIHVAY